MSIREIFNEQSEPMESKRATISKDGIFIPIKKGDVILTGKFRNKATEVKDISINEHGLPVVNGKNITTFRFTDYEPE